MDYSQSLLLMSAFLSSYILFFFTFQTLSYSRIYSILSAFLFGILSVLSWKQTWIPERAWRYRNFFFVLYLFSIIFFVFRLVSFIFCLLSFCLSSCVFYLLSFNFYLSQSNSPCQPFILGRKGNRRGFTGGSMRVRRGVPHWTLIEPSLNPHWTLTEPPLNYTLKKRTETASNC